MSDAAHNAMAAAFLDDIGACPFGHEALGGGRDHLDIGGDEAGYETDRALAAAEAIRLRHSIQVSVADMKFPCVLRCNRIHT